MTTIYPDEPLTVDSIQRWMNRAMLLGFRGSKYPDRIDASPILFDLYQDSIKKFCPKCLRYPLRYMNAVVRRSDVNGINFYYGDNVITLIPA